MAVDPRFFRIVDGIRAVDLAARLGASISNGNTDQIITGVAPLAVAGKGEVTYQALDAGRFCAESWCHHHHNGRCRIPNFQRQ